MREGVAAPERATLHSLLHWRAEHTPGLSVYTVLADGESEAGRLTCAELDRQARAVAARLAEICEPGDRVLLLFPFGLDFIVGFFGCLYAGVIAVPAYPPRPRRDQRLQSILGDARPVAALSTSALIAGQLGRMAELAAIRLLAVDDPREEESGELPRVALDAPAFLQYTSGSTSTPKGVVVTHQNLLHNQEMIRRAFGQDEDSVVVGWLPLYHDMGLIGNLLQPLYSGGRCVLMSPAAFLQRPRRWLEAIHRYRATTSGGPNFAYELCLRKIDDLDGLDLSSWRVAYNGAEPVRAETLERFAERFAPCGFSRVALQPCYGLAEATLLVATAERGRPPLLVGVDAAALSDHRIAASAEGPPAHRLVGCGHVWLEQRLAVVDPETREELPEDRVGELWVAGPSVAAGYWNRPAETERDFHAVLASGDRGETFLRTGDLGFLAGGELFITGRLKDLIILRGRNYYPQDIELTAERSHPALRPGAGAAFSVEIGGEERLVVVQEIERHASADAEEAAQALRRAVSTEHEVQVQDVVLLRVGTLPKTSSGKVQRRLCRTLYLDGSLAVVAHSRMDPASVEAQAGPVDLRALLLGVSEEERHAIVLQALRSTLARAVRIAPEHLDPDVPLTSLGLDSLAAVEWRSAVEAEIGEAPSFAEILEGISLREAGRRLLSGPRHTADARGVEADEGPRSGLPATGDFPLSWGQRSLWFLHRLAPDSAAYTIAGAALLPAGTDADALLRALAGLVERHAALRTTFPEGPDGPFQRIAESAPLAAMREDAAGWSSDELERRIRAEAFRPFDLDQGPLFRAALFTRSVHGGDVLVLSIHHIVADFWSLALLAQELGALYRGDRLPRPVLAPGDHVRWQEERLAGPRGEELWEHWSARLTGVPPLDLPTDRPRPPRQGFQGASRTLWMDPEAGDRVRSLARGEGGTLFVVLAAAFQALLGRLSGQDDFLVGAPTAGRGSDRLSGLVGYLVSPVALRADLSGEPRGNEWLARTRRMVAEAFENGDMPLALLAQRLDPGRDASRPLLFQTLVALQKAPWPGLEGLSAFALGLPGGRVVVGEIELESLPLPAPSSQLDLSLLTGEIEGRLVLSLQYDTDLFDVATAERWLSHLGLLLEGLAAEPSQRVAELPWMTEAERHQVATDWSQAVVIPEERGLHQLFERQAERTPETVALTWAGQRMTYGELNRRAERLAVHLESLGVRSESLVGVFVERRAEMVVSLLGVLKAGGAYVPMDPAYPRDRLAFLLRDSGASLVVTQASLVDRLPESGLTVVDVDAPWPEAPPRPPVSVADDSLAYVIYTSGSTGVPKGVEIRHGSAVGRVAWAGEVYGAERLRKVLCATSLCFDLSVYELFAPLSLGGEVVLVDNALALADLPAEVGVTLVNTVPSAMRELVRAGGVPPSVRTVNLAGEPLRRELVDRLYALDGVEEVWNLYGPSEDTTYSTGVQVPREAAGEPTIGTPLPGTRAYVLNAGDRLLPVGVPGELWLGGGGLARGYRGRPALTADRFRPDPFSGELGARLYRTGDRVRRLEDGQLAFLGRLDQQVKVRGFRIEPGEVEAALLRHPSVGEALVAVREVAGEPHLVAYLAGTAGGRPETEALRAHLRQTLPEALVPTRWVTVEALPRLPNGKVDRAALPEPLPKSWKESAAAATARTPLEELLAGTMADLLGRERLGPDEDFFALGGHSLLAARLGSRLRTLLGIELPLTALFRTPTAAGLAETVAALRRAGAVPEGPPLRRQERSREDLPLSTAQERIWFLERLTPGLSVYNIPAGLRLRGDLSAAALAESLRRIVARHETLRSIYLAVDGQPRQRVIAVADAMPALAQVDLTGVAEAEAELARLAAREAGRPFDLTQAPLLRATLVLLAPGDHALLLTLHHIAADGWSLRVLARELSQLYGDLCADRRPELPELPVQFADFAVWEREWLASGVLEPQLAWWRERLAGAPAALDLPTDRPRPATQVYRGAVVRANLGEESTRLLRGLARREGATLFMTLLSGLSALLARISGQDDLVLGAPVAHRVREELEGLIGLFLNTLPLRLDLSGDPEPRELLAQARESSLAAWAHQDAPFERLVEEIRPGRDLSRSPLFQVLLVLQEAPSSVLRLAGVEAVDLPVHSGTSKFDLTLSLYETAAGLSAELEYDADLFDRTTVERWLEHLESLLRGLAVGPARRLSELPWMTEAQLHQLITEWNDRAAPLSASFPRLFEEQAAHAPERIAVVRGGASLTYGDLDRQAGRLARVLLELGLERETPVGIFLDRQLELPVALLAVMKAGASYVPLDPSYPDPRLAHMIGDARARFILTSRELVDRLALLGEDLQPIFASESASGPERGADAGLPIAPEQIAYTIYTSGSTGRPKGVQVTHGGLANFLLSMREVPGLGPEDRLLAITPVSFDISGLELYLPLLVGARVILADRETAVDGARLAEALRAATVMQATPATWRLLLASGWRGDARNGARVWSGGEALPGALAAELRERSPEVWNLYGPTETTIWSSVQKVETAGDSVTPVGLPIANTSLHVLDRGFRPVPVGVPGELCIGGAGLARGYRGRPDLTADRFIPDPFAAFEQRGERLYRTGDLVRRRPAGEIEFLGRLDHQVKLRGVRIELGEIEAALLEQPGVREAVVLVHGATDDQRLAAYVVCDDPAVAGADLRRALQERLPAAMVPASFRRLPSLPRTPNGKLDRRALPAPESKEGPTVAWTAPSVPLAELLAGVWSEILGVERIGDHDDFFGLGGHSLLATRLVSRIRVVFGVELPVRTVFDRPRLAEMAREIGLLRRSGAGLEEAPLVPVPRGPGIRLPLSSAQQRLWVIEQLRPGSPAYNLAVGLRLRGVLDVRSLAAALDGIVERHEALRTTFRSTGEGTEQHIHPPFPLPLPIVDLSLLPEAVREAEADRASRAEAVLPFDLESGPLVRATLLRLDREDGIALLTLHHIVGDGWSLGVLVRELAVLYPAFRQGLPAPLPPLPVQSADYAVWQLERLRGEGLAPRIAAWQKRLAGAPPVLELPADRSRPALPSGRGGHRPLHLSASRIAELAALGRGASATLFMTLLAVWKVLLLRITHESDLVVGTPVALRDRGEIEGLVGFFVNTLPLRTDLSGTPSFREVLGRVRETLLAAYADQDVPFERLVEELAPERSLAYTPLVQVMFALQNTAPERLDLPGLTLEPFGREVPVSRFDLTLSLLPSAGGLSGTLEFSRDLFESPTMDRLIRLFQTLAEAAASRPGLPVTELPSLSTEEGHQLLLEWNDTAALGGAGSVHAMFSERAQADPGALAVAGVGGELTSGELEAASNRLARHLRRSGVGTESLVAVCLERSPALFVALLGTLKAGGAYVPLDPAYPVERLRFMLRDSGARVVLTESLHRGLFTSASCGVVCLDADRDLLQCESDAPLAVAAEPESLAYVIYTSGSTGQPKGVAVSHGSLRRLVDWYQSTYGVVPSDRVTLIAAPAFDASVWEIWPHLTAGASFHIPAEELRTDPAALTGWLARERVTLCYLPTPLAEAVLQHGLPEGAALRYITTGGDRLRHRPDAGLRCTFVNHYGPSESTVATTWFPVAPGDQAVPPSIGRPIADLSVVLLDPSGLPVPLGVAGELCIGGRQLARGYWRRPDLTAERFLPDPFSGSPGSRLYRSGDLARWLPDGRLDFLGRVDHQVKLRGFRIELGEIESLLRQHPAIHEAVLGVREERAGQARLAAYVVPVGEAVPEPGELAGFLREQLPEHMVPVTFLFLDQLPLTANGKLDRAALARRAAPEAPSGVEMPQDMVEEILAGLWISVLGTEAGRQANFFELGGHSLLATQVMSRVRQAFGVELPLRLLFEAPTVASLAARVRERMGRGASAPPPLEPVPRTQAPPLSFAQQRLWFLDQLEPGSVAYNIPLAVRLAGPLDVPALARSVGEIVRRHETLRTTFAEGEKEPVQVVGPAVPIDVPRVDLGGLRPAARAAEAERLVRMDATLPFDLVAGPLFRPVLLRLSSQEHVVLASMHHIVSDGWSLGVFVRELSALYRAAVSGISSFLPELRVQYADFALWQRQWLSGPALEQEIAHWRQRLQGAPLLLELPADRPRPAAWSGRGASQEIRLPAPFVEQLAARARHESVTLFMLLLGAFQILLHRHAGVSDLPVGTPIAGRNRLEIEGLIGFFVNSLVLRVDLGGDPTVREALSRGREAALDAYAHQDVPFEKLVEELNPERSLSHAPLFQVMFSLQNDPRTETLLPDLALTPVTAPSGTAKLDLSLDLLAHEGALSGSLTYATDLFDRVSVIRLLEYFETLLADLAAAPAETRLADLSLLSAAERHQVVEEWNETATEGPRGLGLHELFEAQAARTPEAVALVRDGERMTYRELDRRAEALAAHLEALGVGPESLVGILVERRPAMVIALLGVLKAGGAYVPMDPAYPQERLAFLLRDSGAAVVVIQESLRDRLQESGAALLDVDQIRPAAAPRRRLPVDGERLAYVIYTSGSTGMPKGVAIRHGGAVERVAWAHTTYGPERLSGVLAATSVCFDLSVFELFAPLGLGGTAILVDNALALAELTAEAGVTLLNTVPSAAQELVRGGWIPRSVRTVNLAGEPLRRELADSLYALPWVEEVWNLYGPSEDTTYSTGVRVPRGVDREPSIGRPLPNSRAYVLDAHGQPLAVGSPGELWLGGAGLARGYHGRPDLTADRFRPDPFARRPGTRLYRTGDQARLLPGGELAFLGRLDHQIKLRGFRIELGEIETVLLDQPGVVECAVLVEGEASGRRLVAYVGGTAPDLDEEGLRRALEKSLPGYMVPAAVVVLPSLPRTPNGKLDRRALVGQEPDARLDLAPEPSTPLRKALAGIWADVLRVEEVRPRDNFFALGGHSLLAARVVAQVRAELAVELPVRALFENPTIAALARVIETTLDEVVAISPVPPIIPLGNDGDLPLSFAQRRLWFLDQLEPGSPAYNMPAAVRLRGFLDPAALSASLAEVRARHEALRARFESTGGEPVQRIAPAGGWAMPLVDLSALPGASREAEAHRQAHEESARPFDLARGPLLRGVLLRLEEGEHIALLTMHHIVADGWSIGLLIWELTALYPALAGGRPSPLPPLPVQYADFAAWQRSWLRGEALDSRLGWWRERLVGAPAALALPTDHPRPASRSGRGAAVPVRFSAGLSAALTALARKERATLFMILLAAWKALLLRLTGQKDLVVGAPVANRSRAEIESLIGLFVNTLALRSRLAPPDLFQDLVRRVREATLDAYRHQDLPFERLVEELTPERDLGRTPLFQVMLVLQNAPLGDLELPGLTLTLLPIAVRSAKVDLTLTLIEDGDGLTGALEYDSDLFTEVTASRLVAWLERLLQGAVADPGRPLAELPLFSGTERGEVVAVWNRTSPGEVPAAHPRESAFTPPRNPVEELLAGIWSEVLGRDRIGVHDNFFARGGHSLLATQVISRIRGLLGVELPLRAIFEASTVSGLARAVHDRQEAHPAPPITPAPRDGDPPLSFAQQRLWFLHELDPGSPAYNIPLGVWLTGKIERSLLRRIFAAIVARHEVLRTTFRVQDGQPVQIVAPPGSASEPDLPLLDLVGLPVARREALALEIAHAEARRPFDLQSGPLLRLTLLRLDEQEHLLLMTFHHIVSDGWSTGVLLREIAALYEAFSGGHPAGLPELPVQYADFAVWQRQWLQGEALRERLEAWRRQLSGAPQVLELPLDRPRPAVQTFRGASRSFDLPSHLSHAAQEICRREGVTPFMVLLAAWALLLGRHAGQEDVLLGTPIAGRNRREIEGLIGFFVNTLVLRTDLSGSPGFAALLGRVRRAALDAYTHQDVPFERLVEELVLERDLSRSPLFQVLLVFQNASDQGLRLPGLALTPLSLESGVAKFELTLTFEEKDDLGLAGTLSYNTDLFDSSTAARLGSRFAALLAAAMALPEIPLSELPQLLPEEQHQVLVEWNDAARHYRTGVCLHELITEQAQRTPEVVAAAFDGRELSYRELDSRANQLAHHLTDLGVALDDRVGVLLERSLEMIVALLGILKAGAAYVPLDPTYPAERLSVLVETAGARVVLSQERWIGQLPEGSEQTVLLDVDWQDIESRPQTPPSVQMVDGNLAYVIFTSGSTGTPKGVMIPHRGIVNRLLWMQEAYGLTPQDRVLQKTPFSFDVSVWEFFWPLLVGARLVFAKPEGHKDPFYLTDLIGREEITVLHFVPSMLHVFLEAPELEILTSLRKVLASGEALPPELVRRFYFRLRHGAELHNLYGPTEASVDVSFWDCASEPSHSLVPIGRPIANLRLVVVDRELLLQPPGVPGELLLGGVGLARGYLGRADLTAAAFVPDPFGEEPGERLYRTGDLTRSLPDGSVEYLGRTDHQVKIRGFRIELGEIEAALVRCPGVREAVVLAREEPGGDRRLVAYLVADSMAESTGAETGPETAHVRDFLRGLLPAPFLPSAFVWLPALPLSPNGKIDRRALPPPPSERPVGLDADFVAPGNPFETSLAEIWREVLGVGRVGAQDDFFDLGGHSLLATQVASRVRQALGIELPLRVLFEAPTLAGLSRVMAGLAREAGAPLALPRAPRVRTAPVPPSIAQHRLWFLQQLDPRSSAFHIPGALRLTGRLDPASLERSLAEICRRHESLRTTFLEIDGEPYQVITPPAPRPLARIDLGGLPEPERGRELERLLHEEGNAPFDLARGPLWRTTLVHTAVDEHALLFTFHHIISDGWSMASVLTRELATLYEAFASGRPSPLPDLAVQYAEYAVWQRQWLQSEVLRDQLAYWRNRLGGPLPALDLPLRQRRPAVPSFRGRAVDVSVPRQLELLLQELGRQEGATLFMTLLAAFAALLHCTTAQDDLVIGTDVANRSDEDLEKLIGFFVNNLALRMDFSGAPSFRELLRRVREVALGAYTHQNVPIDSLIEELQPERSGSYAPLFQVMFVLQDFPQAELAIPGLTLSPLDLQLHAAPFALSLMMTRTGDGLAGRFVYAADLFEDATVVRLAAHFMTLLEQVAADPDRNVKSQMLIHPTESMHMVGAFNDDF